MKKADFIEKLSEKINQTKKDTAAFLDEFVSLVVKTLKSGDEVVLPEMGKWLLKKRPKREGRNPITGAKVMIPAKVVPQFRASKKFKTEVA
jgi:DNA-binding protein HU-beta